MKKRKSKILLIDQHPEWLDFARAVLQEDYEVLALKRGENLSLENEVSSLDGFDLVFIGLELATNNLDALKPLFKQWHFVVIFPVLQSNDTVRLLFKAGVYDCARKPYEREGLLKLVADELALANIANGHSKFVSSRRTSQELARSLATILKLEDSNHDTDEKDTSSRR
jgi:response regulator RpfG family c-di-GMP phosphodiesterase